MAIRKPKNCVLLFSDDHKSSEGRTDLAKNKGEILDFGITGSYFTILTEILY